MQRTISRSLYPAALMFLLVLPMASQAESLGELYRLAAENDLTLKTASYQRDAALEAKPQAWAALLPQVGAEATFLKNRFQVDSVNSDSSYIPTEERYNSHEYSLTLSQTLFDWTAFKTLAQADNQVAQAEAAYRSAQQNLIARLVQAYFKVLAAQDTLRADLDAQAAFKQQLDQQQDKYKSGVATVTDAKNAQASYDSSTATVIADRNAVSAARRALATIVGRPVDNIDPVQEDIALVAPNPLTVESWTDAAAKSNFDVIATRFAAESAKNQVEASRGRYLPTLSAVGSITSEDSESTFGYEAETDYVGLKLAMDIFRGGQVSSVVRQARATELAALARYQLQLRTVDQNVRDHYDSVINGIAGVKAAIAAVSSNQSSVISTEVGFKVGTRTVIDVLNSRQALAAAQKTLSQSRYDYLLNLLLLKSDVGQLAEGDIADIDRLLIKGGGSAPRSGSSPARGQ